MRKKYIQLDKDQARKYYVIGLNLFEISKLLNIPYKTLEKWQQKFEWKKMRSDNLLYFLINELSDKGLHSSEICSVLKISPTTFWRSSKKVKQKNY